MTTAEIQAEIDRLTGMLPTVDDTRPIYSRIAELRAQLSPVETIVLLIPADDAGFNSHITDADINAALSARRAGKSVRFINSRGGAIVAAPEQTDRVLDYMLVRGLTSPADFTASMIPSGAYVEATGFFQTDMFSIIKTAAIFAAATYGAGQLFAQQTAAVASSAAGQAMAATIYDPIAAMTGAGVGVSDAVIAATAASAKGVASAGAAIAEMQGAQWGALITGNVAGPAATVAALAAKVATQTTQVAEQLTGGDMGTIFDNISGTISSIGNTVSSAYGTVLDTQIKMAQLDVLKAQAKADLYQQPVSGGVVSGGGLNIGMIGIMALVALGGLMLYMRKG